MLVYILDDSEDIIEVEKFALEKMGFEVEGFTRSKPFFEKIRVKKPDMILLDIFIYEESGYDVLNKLRASVDTKKIPVIMVSACDSEFDKTKGLDAGADDYVTKPFKLLELLSRIRALLRRNKSTVYSCENIVIDINTMTVKKDGENVFVTPTEFQILSALIRNSGVIVTRAILLENIWDEGGSFIDDNTLSVHISRLREKIGPEHIVTVRGIGYRWEDGK